MIKKTALQLAASILVAALVTSFTGCGDGAEGTAVSGKVSYNGAPVPQGTIAFLKSGAPVVGGPIGSDGSYSVSLPPGDYQVRIDAMASPPEGWKESDPLPPRLVPEKYAAFDTSGLTVTVGADTPQQHDVSLP